MNAEKLLSDFLGVLTAVAAISAMAQLSISLPETVSVAPITGQSLAILVAAHLLKWKNATIAVLLYIIIGTLGLPVFSGFSGGSAIIFGKSAGYLFGFIIASAVVGAMADNANQRFKHYLLQMTIGTSIILVLGGIGLLRFLEPKEIFALGIKPFIGGGIAKILLGAILLSIYRRFRLLINMDKTKANS